ncbi:hypothetical protein HY490_00915 [Candidatus Woesearchaeota archaeon]|nr:hypothetical protein [Candidatus Woesearchaeota archaeon]
MFSFDFSYHEPTEAWKRSRGLLLDHANHENGLWMSDCEGVNYELRFRRTMENFAVACLGRAPNYLSGADLRVNTALSVKLTNNSRWTYK